MRRLVLVWRFASLAGALLALAAGCTQPLHVKNAAPRVTEVTAAAVEGDTLRILFWLEDHEEDPVDVVVAYATDEALCGALRADVAAGDAPDPEDAGLALIVEAPGGHGTTGLATDAEAPGRPHEVVWDTRELADATVACLYVVPDDRSGRAGDPQVSPTFSVREGFGPPPPAPAEDVVAPAEDVVAAD